MSEAKREALWLAEKMGLPNPTEQYGRVYFSVTGGLHEKDWQERFDPHTNKAQFADVLLWAAKQGYVTLAYCEAEAWCGGPESSEKHIRHDQTDASIMAATLTAICRASGYQGE